MNASLWCLILSAIPAYAQTNHAETPSPEAIPLKAVAPKFESEACRKSYLRLYSNPDGTPKDSLRITVAFGYNNYESRGYVDDLDVAGTLAHELTRRCAPPRLTGLCGFTRGDDATVFERTLTGPDGQPKTVRLALTNSAATSDDDANRGAKRAEQDAKTKLAEANFCDGLKNSDIVLYKGHSREGGGPSFETPPLMTGSRVVDENWYKQHGNPNLQRMLECLKQAKSPPKVIGLFACGSTPVFYDVVHKTSPTSVFIGTKSIASLNDLTLIQENAIDAFLSMKCEPYVRNALRTSPVDGNVQFTPTKANPMGNSFMNGFF